MNDRVIIGNLDNGTNYGLRISKAGQDAINGTALQTTDKLLFDTLYPTDGFFVKNIYDITVSANSSYTHTFSSALTIIPLTVGFEKVSANDFISDNFTVLDNWGADITGTYPDFDDAGFYWEITKTTLKVFNQDSSQKTYRIFTLGINQEGAGSGGSSLQPPTALSIANVSETSQTFSYTASAGAEDHKLDISTLVDFSSFVTENLSIGTTSYTKTGLTAKTAYYYRARAIDETPSPDETSSNSVTVVKTTPGVADDCGVVTTSWSFSGASETVVICYLSLLTDGNSIGYRSTGLGGNITDEDWYTAPAVGVGSNYYVKFTIISGPTGIGTVYGSADNTWLQLNAQRDFGIQRDGAGFASDSITFRVDISTAGSDATIIETSSNIILTATNQFGS